MYIVHFGQAINLVRHDLDDHAHVRCGLRFHQALMKQAAVQHELEL